jgi:hypothetical protein
VRSGIFHGEAVADEAAIVESGRSIVEVINFHRNGFSGISRVRAAFLFNAAETRDPGKRKSVRGNQNRVWAIVMYAGPQTR